MKIKQSLTTLSTALTHATGRAGLILKKNSPEILMAVGIVGVFATIVDACYATLKADEVLDHHAEKMKKIDDVVEYQDEEAPYLPEAVTRDKLVVYTQTGIEFARLYAPTIAIGTLSIASILVSNHLIKQRYLAVVAAYNAISVSYDQYRRRVRKKYGDIVDYEMMYGVEREKIEVKETDENGKTTKKKEEIEIINDQPSNYARVWSKYLKDGVLNPNWDDNSEFNMMFLKGVETEANHILHGRGYIFLNEVYDMLGYDHTQLGQVVGWFDDGTGDGYIDFGLYNLNNWENRRFINGEDAAVLLDFNCDGIIWDKI